MKKSVDDMNSYELKNELERVNEQLSKIKKLLEFVVNRDMDERKAADRRKQAQGRRKTQRRR